MIAFAVMMLIGTVASSVNAFKLFGHSFGDSKDNTPEQQEQVRAQEQVRLTNTEIVGAIKKGNADKRTTDFLKSGFSDESFCVKTETRVAYVEVLSDGSLKLVNEHPPGCHVLRTSEEYALRAHSRFMDGENIPYREIKRNVDIPYKVRLRATWAAVFG